MLSCFQHQVVAEMSSIEHLIFLMNSKHIYVPNLSLTFSQSTWETFHFYTFM